MPRLHFLATMACAALISAATVAAVLHLHSPGATALAGEKGGPIYAQLSSQENQTVGTVGGDNKLTLLKMETTDALSGLGHDKAEEIAVKTTGLYFLSVTAQVTGTVGHDVYLWIRVNGNDVVNSRAKQVFPKHGDLAGPYALLVYQRIIECKTGDVITVPGSSLGASAVTSVGFSMFKIN